MKYPKSMSAISQTRTIRLKIPTLVESFYYALNSEDYDTCADIKKFLYDEYESFNDNLKVSFRVYLQKYLEEMDIDNQKDLNGLFNTIFMDDEAEKIES